MNKEAVTKLQDTVKKLKANKKPVIFLGGDCTDNAWREDLQKGYGKHFLFLDPYDENWKPENNIYDEMKGMLRASYVVFYNGGKQTKLEKDFLKGQVNPDRIKEFDSVAEVKKFFEDLIKYESLADRIRKLAYQMEKQSVPYIPTKMVGKAVDLHFEYLDQEARKNVIKDFKSGVEINLPDFQVPGKEVPEVESIKKSDYSIEDYLYIMDYMTRLSNKPSHTVLMDYDPILHKYYQIEPAHAVPEMQYAIREPAYAVKTAKTGVSYSKGCAMVPVPVDLSRSIMTYGTVNVPDKDLYTKEADQGRENDIHITLFYGFTEDDPEEIAEILKGIKPFTVRLGLVNAFKDQKEYDVLKITAESPELEKLHYLLEKKLKNDNKHPTYSAHLTVAYVKKGKVDKLIGDDRFRGIEFRVDHIDYSGKDNNRTSIQFG